MPGILCKTFSQTIKLKAKLSIDFTFNIRTSCVAERSLFPVAVSLSKSWHFIASTQNYFSPPSSAVVSSKCRAADKLFLFFFFAAHNFYVQVTTRGRHRVPSNCENSICVYFNSAFLRMFSVRRIPVFSISKHLCKWKRIRTSEIVIFYLRGRPTAAAVPFAISLCISLRGIFICKFHLNDGGGGGSGGQQENEGNFYI